MGDGSSGRVGLLLLGRDEERPLPYENLFGVGGKLLWPRVGSSGVSGCDGSLRFGGDCAVGCDDWYLLLGFGCVQQWLVVLLKGKDLRWGYGKCLGLVF